jgi:predicted metal-binding protein
VRKVKVQPPDTPAWKRWITRCEKATKQIQEQIDRGEKPIFDEKIYQKYKEFFMDAAFHGKCGYCECPVRDFQHGDVEHFRPKAMVTNEKDEVIYDHPGYHWLVYDWQNLLISCVKCNQIFTRGNQKIGKGNRFPVKGLHALTPETLAQEKPLLINPTGSLPEDRPSKHLAINPDGSLRGLTDRGKMCIQVFGLNHRDQLVSQRKRAYREALLLKGQLQSSSKDEQQEAIQEIIAIKQGKKSYSIAQAEAVAALKALS